MQEQVNTQKYEDDEIDLRELFKTLAKNKVMIFVFTMLVTLVAGIYAFNSPKVYEAHALVEIGNFNSSSSSSSSSNLLDNASQLSRKLNVLFIDMFKNVKDKESFIASIKVPKKSMEFIEIRAEGSSNEAIKKEIQNIVLYIQEKHQKVLNDVKQRREIEISNIENKIDNIQNREIPLLNKKIKIQEASLNDFNNQIKLISKNLKNIESSNPSLTALKLMEKRDLTSFVIKLNTLIMDLRDKIDTLSTTTINNLKENKLLVESLLLPHNYKNSAVIGRILTNEHPIKPKKKLIIVVAFITGFILSIFLVFFLEFVKGFKEEERET